jgi:hypothetical protein
VTPALPARTRLAAWAAFAPALAVWTWKLLEPNPVPERIHGLLSLSDWLPFLLAKSLHLGGYAFLAALLWAAVPRPWRWAAVVFLLLHGVGTEVGQCYVPNRAGTVRDVVIDWCGIAVGVLAARAVANRLFTPARSRPAETPSEMDESSRSSHPE